MENIYIYIIVNISNYFNKTYFTTVFDHQFDITEKYN